MTKKDFELIARIIATSFTPEDQGPVALAFARKLREANPKFNVVTFMRACRPYNADTYTARKDRYHAG